MRTIWTASIPLIIWTALMVTASSIPRANLPEAVSFWQWDKLAHLFEYHVFGMLLFRYLHLGRSMTFQPALLGTAAIGLVFAVMDEIHQIPIPSRECTRQDLIADFAGVATSILFVGLVKKTRLKACTKRQLL